MHLDEKKLKKFQNNEMDTNDMLAFLEHLDTCDFCLEQMLDMEDAHPAVSTPIYLKEEILSRAASPEIQAQKALRSTSHKMQLFYLGLRTAVGIGTALVLLFTAGSQINFTSVSTPTFLLEEASPPEVPKQRKDYLYNFSREISDGISDGSQKITDYLNDVSNKLLHGGK